MSLVLNEEQSYLKDTARDFAKTSLQLVTSEVLETQKILSALIVKFGKWPT